MGSQKSFPEGENIWCFFFFFPKSNIGLMLASLIQIFYFFLVNKLVFTSGILFVFVCFLIIVHLGHLHTSN